MGFKNLTAGTTAKKMPFGGKLNTAVIRCRTGEIAFRLQPTDDWETLLAGDGVEIDSDDTTKDSGRKIESTELEFVCPAAGTLSVRWTLK